jgi:chromosome segregation ATPase
MFTRVKRSRREDYLQIVQNYRDGDRVRQRLVLYVGRYDSIDEALHRMRGDLRNWRARRTSITRFARPEERGESARKELEDLNCLIEATDPRLQALRALVKAHPELLERDRKRLARRPGQVAARIRARRERERRESAERSDQQKELREKVGEPEVEEPTSES